MANWRYFWNLEQMLSKQVYGGFTGLTLRGFPHCLLTNIKCGANVNYIKKALAANLCYFTHVELVEIMALTFGQKILWKKLL